MADLNDTTPTHRRPAPVLLLAAIVSIVVSLIALLGLVPSLVDWHSGGFDARWLLVAGSVVLGVALLFVPGRRRSR